MTSKSMCSIRIDDITIRNDAECLSQGGLDGVVDSHTIFQLTLNGQIHVNSDTN